jgi:hypothetical protein
MPTAPPPPPSSSMGGPAPSAAATSPSTELGQELKAAGVTVPEFEELVAAASSLTGFPALDANEVKAAMQLAGGALLDEALSKGIQLTLIGGASALFDALLVFMNNDPKLKALSMFKKMLQTKIGPGPEQWLTGYQEGDLTGNSTAMSNITKRVNGVLQVKDGDKYVSLDEYKGRANNSNFNADQIACFEGGKKVLNDDGTAAVQECITALQNAALWKVKTEEIAEINPRTAFNILKSLGFGGVNRSGKVQVQSYQSWEDSLSDAAKTTLDINNSFQADFIKNVVAFVNANPAILNKGDIELNSAADKYGVKAATWNKRSSDSELNDVRQGIEQSLALIAGRVGVLTGHVFSPFGVIRGGYSSPAFLFPAKGNNRIENMPKYSAQLRVIYNNMVAKLNSYNKTLGETTKESIEKIFTSLEKHENEAVAAINKLEAYYLDNRNRNSAVIDKDAMTQAEKNLEKNMQKLRKRAINIVDIQAVLNNAIKDAAKVSPLGNL